MSAPSCGSGFLWERLPVEGAPTEGAPTGRRSHIHTIR